MPIGWGGEPILPRPGGRLWAAPRFVPPGIVVPVDPFGNVVFDQVPGGGAAAPARAPIRGDFCGHHHLDRCDHLDPAVHDRGRSLFRSLLTATARATFDTYGVTPVDVGADDPLWLRADRQFNVLTWTPAHTPDRTASRGYYVYPGLERPRMTAWCAVVGLVPSELPGSPRVPPRGTGPTVYDQLVAVVLTARTAGVARAAARVNAAVPPGFFIDGYRATGGMAITRRTFAAEQARVPGLAAWWQAMEARQAQADQEEQAHARPEPVAAMVQGRREAAGG